MFDPSQTILFFYDCLFKSKTHKIFILKIDSKKDFHSLDPPTISQPPILQLVKPFDSKH